MVEGGPAVAAVRIGRGCSSTDQRFRRCPGHPPAGDHQRGHSDVVARSVAERIGVGSGREYRRDGFRIVHGYGLVEVHASRDRIVVPGEESGCQLDPVLYGEVDGLPADPGLRLRIDAASDQPFGHATTHAVLLLELLGSALADVVVARCRIAQHVQGVHPRVLEEGVAAHLSLADDGYHRQVVHLRCYVIEAPPAIVPPRRRAAVGQQEVSAFSHLRCAAIPSLHREDVQRGVAVLVRGAGAESPVQQGLHRLGVDLAGGDVHGGDPVRRRLCRVYTSDDPHDLFARPAVPVGRLELLQVHALPLAQGESFHSPSVSRCSTANIRPAMFS